MTEWALNNDLPGSVAPLVNAIKTRPDFARRLAEMARSLKPKLSKSETLALALRARALAPGDAYVWRMTENIVRQSIPNWHWAIARDEVRNDTYDRAIKANITPESVVFEIGAGTGILAMMAARAGAAHVYTCEIVPALACAARENIARNGYADKITVIEADAKDLKVGALLPQRCNVFLHEIVSNDLFAEDVLQLTAYTREHLLTPDAVHLPDRIWTKGQLIESNSSLRSQKVGTHAGFDLSAINLMTSSVARRNGPTDAENALSAPFVIGEFNLQAGNQYPALETSQDIPVTASGELAAVLQWIGFSFPDGTVFENGPETKTSWAHVLHPIEPPRHVTAGQQISLKSEYKNYLLALQITGQP